MEHSALADATKWFSPCAKRDERLTDSTRARAVTGPLRERRRGAAEECRSDARNTTSEQQSVPKSSVCFGRSDERVGLQRPVRERNTIKMGEAPVKYELAGAS